MQAASGGPFQLSRGGSQGRQEESRQKACFSGRVLPLSTGSRSCRGDGTLGTTGFQIRNHRDRGGVPASIKLLSMALNCGILESMQM